LNTTRYDWINETWNLYVCPFDFYTTRYDWINETSNLFVWPFDF
jgi:hypothetical protein